jgi:integrase
VTRKTLKKLGAHGRSVHVFAEGALVRVQWRETGQRRTESWPGTGAGKKEALAYAKGVEERLARRAPEAPRPITVGALGEAFLLAHPVPETWRPKTLSTFLARWKVWVAFATRERRIDTVTPETLDRFRAAMRADDYAINQVANHVQMVKAVWRFARERKLITENQVADYRMKLSRDQRRLEVPEWTPDECAKILAQLSPRAALGWRPWAAVVLDSLLGGRSRALLALEWRDVDLGRRVVRWRPELDKLARDREQPLPREAAMAFRVAAVWRRRIGYEGPFVFPGAQDRTRGVKPWGYSALNQALRAAATKAGVRWVDYRAMHGFRRMAVNNVLALTGDLTKAGQWIGDTDARTLSRSYVRARPEELRDLSAKVVLPPKAPKMTRSSEGKGPSNGNGPASAEPVTTLGEE